MNKNIWITLCCVSISYPVFATADDPREPQEGWRRHHVGVETLAAERRVIQTANPSLDPIPEFSKLSINARPHPELYHLYLRDHQGGMVNLVKDVRSQTLRMVRLYGASHREPSYVTMGSPASMLPKETLVTPLSSSEVSASGRPPAGASSSYPTGLKTYYINVNNKKIEFQKGHGIPNEDTLRHSGTTSTRDAENYVPQNIKYNSPIRRDLEAELRNLGLQYKEIAIYHGDCLYEAGITGSAKRFNIPVPEGFLFMTFEAGGDIRDTYYFPNFVDYEALSGSTPLKGDKKNMSVLRNFIAFQI